MKDLVRPWHLGGLRVLGSASALTARPLGLLVTQRDTSSPMHSHVEDSDPDHLFSHLFTQMFIQLLLCARNEEGAVGMRRSLSPWSYSPTGRGRLI